MPSRPILAILSAMLAVACTPAGSDAVAHHAGTARPAEAPATPSLARLHGNWRLVAADDPHDAALMAFSVQADDGDTVGSGDFMLFQPFCDAVAGTPITGTADCELIGFGAAFDRVEIDGERIALAFHPTADGLPHRLALRRHGDALAGDYLSEANGIRRAVVARRVPADAP